MVAESCTEAIAATSFDPRQRRNPRHDVGGPPPRQLVTTSPIQGTVDTDSTAVTDTIPPLIVGALEDATTAQEMTAGQLPGRQRRPGSREIHVTLSEKAYRLLEAARNENPGMSYGDLIAAALVHAKPTLLAARPTPSEDPLLRPARTQRLHVEGRTRSRPFNVIPAQANAIRALADEAGIHNLSELVDRSVVLTYDALASTD